MLHNKKGMFILLKALGAILIFALMFYGLSVFGSNLYNSIVGERDTFSEYVNFLSDFAAQGEEGDITFGPVRIDENVLYVGMNPRSDFSVVHSGDITLARFDRPGECSDEFTCVCECVLRGDSVTEDKLDEGLNSGDCRTIRCEDTNFLFREEQLLVDIFEGGSSDFMFVGDYWLNSAIILNTETSFLRGSAVSGGTGGGGGSVREVQKNVAGFTETREIYDVCLIHRGNWERENDIDRPVIQLGIDTDACIRSIS